ncbi:MAG: M15 family metallopeptidase [Spirochaetaceae bacterium]|nr:M15 family metallopeptidase [Spirochaetaceae bacterium]
MRFFVLICLTFFIFTFAGCVSDKQSDKLEKEIPAEQEITETANSDTQTETLIQQEKSILPESESEKPEEEKIPQSFAEKVFLSYQKAYPDKNISYYNNGNDWVISLNNKEFCWADGRLLPKDKADKFSDYDPQQIYPYTGKPRNPAEYTKEKIALLKQKGTQEALQKEKPVDESFIIELLGVKNRIITEEKIVKSQLLGHRLNIHKYIKDKISTISNEIESLAAKDKEIADFIKTVYETSGYNWRTIDGTNERRSCHSYGIAIDVLIKNNKKTTYWEWERVWNPDWMLVPQKRLWTPPEAVIKSFEKQGFVWGGTWDEYDTMHFEYRPELIELGKLMQD